MGFNTIRRTLFGISILLASAMASAATQYNVNRSVGSDGGTVVGSITTDDTIGTLLTANILAWDFTLTSPNLAASPSTISSSDPSTWAGVVSGSAFTATATDLFFDFGAAGPAYVLFWSTPIAGDFWCLDADGGCLATGLTDGEMIGQGDSSSVADFTAHSSRISVATVPLPAAAWLFVSALGGLVVAKRKQLKA